MNNNLELSQIQKEAVEYLDSNLIVSAGAGSGKCVVGDSITFTDRGLIQIQHIPNFYSINNTYCNASILNYTINGNREINNTSNWFKFDIENTKKIITSKGFEEEGTHEHSILCIDTTGTLFFKKFKDICVGDVVLISKNNEMWNTDNIISDELARLLGFLVADGYLNQNYGLISFSNTDKNVISEYYRLWKTLFNVTDISTRKHPTKNSLEHDITSIDLKRKFENEYGLKMVLSPFKEIPQLILQSRSCAINFLQSYMDLDSSVDLKRGVIEITTASEKLSKQLQVLLLNFGIISIRNIKNVKNYEFNTYYRLTISGNSLRVFNEKIGYYTNIENSNNLNKICERKSNTNCEVMYNIQEQFKLFKNEYLKYHKLYNGKEQLFDSMSLKDYICKKRKISNIKLLKLLSYFDDVQHNENFLYLKNLAENFFFDSIKNIKDSKNVVYDFTVPQNSCFVSNGFISHNTKVLTNKIAHLINKGYEPNRILAITFTNKAANEVISRVCDITNRKKSEFPWVKTFHSACFKIIKNHSELFGFKKPIAVHTPNYAKRDMIIALSNIGIDKASLKTTADTMLSVVSNAKNNGNIKEYLSDILVQGFTNDEVIEIYNKYNDVLRNQNAVDFDDILLMTMIGFREHEDIRNEYKNHFQYILVDEFQDSNNVQNEILKLLGNNGNMTVCGDDFQSVYGFRGANPAHFIDFESVFSPSKMIKLEKNYRSTKEIVQAANVVIDNNKKQIKKNCFAHRNGDKLTFRQFQISDREAEWVAEKTLELIKTGTQPDKISVLYRTKAMSMIMEQKFRLKNIPYTSIGSIGFYDRREVADLNSYLFSIYNELDDAAFERIINVPKRGISDKTIEKIRKSTTEKLSLQQKCKRIIESGNIHKELSKGSFEKLMNLMQIINENKDKLPRDAIENVIERINYIEYIDNAEKEDKARLKRKMHMDELIEVVSGFDSVEEFFEGMSLIREDVEDPTEDTNVVKLMTVHAAKGLEWDVVFFVGVNDGMIPHKYSLLEAADKCSTAPIEEERRLMYVAMTRAANKLYITSSKYHNTREYQTSRFIKEIPSELLIKEIDNNFGIGYNNNYNKQKQTFKRPMW